VANDANAICHAFGGTADVAGLGAGSPQQQMSPLRTPGTSSLIWINLVIVTFAVLHRSSIAVRGELAKEVWR